jgi:ABC-type lipoprotein release transport system permease subunit
VLNAAVILKDSSDAAVDAAIEDIERAGAKAGLPIKAISWQTASGLIGQFVVLMKAVLYTAVLVIFLVALVIINNALVIATLERVREIGALRAIGAQRTFILGMLLIEGITLGIFFGALGAATGAAVVLAIGSRGIPAFNDIALFFFSGPRFHPHLGSDAMAIALAIVVFVSLLSSLYPALLAMRVTPRQAMQSED